MLDLFRFKAIIAYFYGELTKIILELSASRMGLQDFPSVLCFKGFWDPHSIFLRIQKSKSKVLNSEIFQLYPNGLANRQTDARLIMFYQIAYCCVPIQVHVPPYLAHRNRRLRR